MEEDPEASLVLGFTEEVNQEVLRSTQDVMLRLMMKQREDVILRLAKLDYKIWFLEELLRTEGP